MRRSKRVKVQKWPKAGEVLMTLHTLMMKIFINMIKIKRVGIIIISKSCRPKERLNKASYKRTFYDKSPSILYVHGIWTPLRQWDATHS